MMKKMLALRIIFAIILGLAIVVSPVSAGVISDAPRVTEILLKILNFLLYVFGILAIIGLLVGSVFYIISAGDERNARNAKRIIGYCVVGIVIALSSLAIVKTIGLIIGS